jgi:hypothetical protein
MKELYNAGNKMQKKLKINHQKRLDFGNSPPAANSLQPRGCKAFLTI